MEILDVETDQTEQSNYTLSSIWSRVWALLLDSLILGAVVGSVGIYNFIDIKSAILVAISSIAGIIYKPFMEYKYGATLGKMALKIKVVNYYHEPITLQQAILRSILQIIPSLISMAVMIIIITSGAADSIDNFTEYTLVVGENKLAKMSQYISYIILIDYLFVFFDNNNRCLHDRIASTLVVKPIQ
jgi:uncharacterized RDD family membrane protein YckC